MLLSSGWQVEAEFSPWKLGLSDEAVHKLIDIVGPRYKASKKVVKLVAREMATSDLNRDRVLQQVPRLPLPPAHTHTPLACAVFARLSFSLSPSGSVASRVLVSKTRVFVSIYQPTYSSQHPSIGSSLSASEAAHFDM